MIFQEQFPPRPTIEALEIETRRQVYSAVTGKVLAKGRGSKEEVMGTLFSMREFIDGNKFPAIFGFPNIKPAGILAQSLGEKGPVLSIFDVDGVIFPNKNEEYEIWGPFRIFISPIIRSLLRGSSVKQVADIPQNGNGHNNPNAPKHCEVAVSRSLSPWPRQKALSELFSQEASMPYVYPFDRHHPPEEGEKMPRIWKVFGDTLKELVYEMGLNGNHLNIIHHGDILPPLAFLGGNEGVIMHWLGKFFSGLGIQTNPTIAFFNPVFPPGGMMLDQDTLKFVPLKGAEV